MQFVTLFFVLHFFLNNLSGNVYSCGCPQNCSSEWRCRETRWGETCGFTTTCQCACGGGGGGSGNNNETSCPGGYYVCGRGCCAIDVSQIPGPEEEEEEEGGGGGGGGCSVSSWGEWSPPTWCGTVTQTRTNNCGGSENQTTSCTECGPRLSEWSACNPNTHKRTRTCIEDCGSNDCPAFVAVNEMEQDCVGEIRGTLFDATNLVSCPSFDPATGYLIGVDTTLTANNREFVINDQSVVPTHPWAPITTPQTDSSGNYSVRVYAPATYAYDFTNLRDIYVVSEGPKLTCTSAAAVVPGNPSNCGTQPCSIVNNMSFGFERYWSGWWQVQGAGVHGELGLRTSIPSGLATEQSMILPESTTGNRRGVATYGMQTTNMLGVNTNARVSASLWQALSPYQGVIYDYAYFNQQFKKFVTTTWDGVSPLTYDDGGRGYQIVKVNGSVNNFSYSPTGTEKIIFLINGDVTINSNITVPSGAFMAVLSSGSINFGTIVTNVDGWYLADHIYIRCVDNDSDSECDRNDNQFVGNGSFVGWEGVHMNRDRGGANNILGPSEKFNYRLDLYENAPEPMKIVTRKYKPYVP